jgi:hypothetical protein
LQVVIDLWFAYGKDLHIASSCYWISGKNIDVMSMSVGSCNTVIFQQMKNVVNFKILEEYEEIFEEYMRNMKILLKFSDYFF